MCPILEAKSTDDWRRGPASATDAAKRDISALLKPLGGNDHNSQKEGQDQELLCGLLPAQSVLSIGCEG